ncbi:MAG: ATP-dependent RecD-like DNA helicase [Chlamydiae bacterium]|nr:ATP-dependent RecD-like DNA helicase [Chlamydiota bacterium]
METILGYIENITFVNPDNGFTIAKLKEGRKKEFTCIVGYLPAIQPGETLQCQGEWKNHPTYGMQFEVKEFSSQSPSDIVGIQKYLESGLIKGIGPFYAEKIVKEFGIDTLNVIDTTPEKLTQISGIGEKRVQKIKECFDAQKAIRNVIIFLRTYGVSPSYAQKIFKVYGENSISKIKENPYQLAKDIFGIGFKSADKIAQKLGIDLKSPIRIFSGLEFVLWELTNEGHSCYPEKEFIPIAKETLEVEENVIQEAIDALVLKSELVKSQLNSLDYLWLKPLYFFESGIAKELNRIKASGSFLRAVDAPKAIEWVQKKLTINLADKQKTAVIGGVSDKIHIITGGPGTGKSTITNAILTITEKLSKKIILCAPTGRAAKRMTEITKKKAFTIHALLEFDFSSGGFKKNKNDPIKADLIIIDEASMIDTSLMYYLLRAIPNEARIIFVGDIDQLPSVGPGNVLKDIIASKSVALTKLTEIFRQAASSKIILNAHRINSGGFPDISNSPRSDFIFYEMEEPEMIKKKIVDLVKFELPKTKKFNLDDIQVLSPMKKGIIGCNNLNLSLQEALNPSSMCIFRNGYRYQAKDKVIQLKNNYSKQVYNGDIGKIVQIDLSEQLVMIAFEERMISYDFSELDEISLAYAISVHKFQGSEAPCIIVPVHMSHYKLLHRNLLYTAITRGKKHVIVLGTKKALFMTIKNEEILKRHSGLEKAIKDYETMVPAGRF